MCGILLVKSTHTIPLYKHLSAFARLQRRGPDFCRYDFDNDIFIGQAVLHITGSDDYYHTVHRNFLSYNGEIYNYRQLGQFDNDIEFVHHAVENDMSLFKQAWGPWSWAWTNKRIVRYASDPQGERCLYQYQDDDILIVCSEIAPILEYVTPELIDMDYDTRHWCMPEQTPYRGITRIQPGQMYENGKPVQTIDSVWDWIRPAENITEDQAYEEFRWLWRDTCQLMQADRPAALTYSGGLDTSVILSHMPDLELYTTNMIGKDPIAESVHEFLTATEQARLHMLNVDENGWARAFEQILAHTRMPVQSWSFVGQWIINQHCKQPVIFTGAGADELFGGYDCYQRLKFSTQASVSPYSHNGDQALWRQCLDAYDDHAGQATLLMDYWYQIASCDARGIDVCAGAWGKEARNPFLAKPIMQLALNLPFELKVGAVPKPLIRRLFLERWTKDKIMPKKGFTGHCNDALPWMGVPITATGNRDQDWHQVVINSFRSLTMAPTDQTTQVRTVSEHDALDNCS